jgi:hypothetical protein
MKFRDALGRWLEQYDLALYLVLFLASLFLRLSTLSASPLNENEALQAWGALHLLRGSGAVGGSSALFASLTAGILFLAGPSHWAPRIVPALAGSLLVFLPLIFRPTRGKLESALAALLIALSPSLWIVSTLAGGAGLGLLAAAACIFFLRGGQSRPATGGILLGLALAAGTVGWSGLAIALIVLAVDWAWRRARPEEQTARVSDPLKESLTKIFQSPAGLAGLAVGIAAGSTGMFFFPRGAGVLATGMTDWLAAFFSGWPKLGEFILLMVAYEPLALVFGVAGLVLLRRTQLSAEDRFLALFAGVASLWVLIRPAAFPADALWVILPLLLLGARALRAAVESQALDERPLFIAIQFCLTILLILFSAFSLAAFSATGEWWQLLLALAGIVVSLLFGPILSDDWRRAIVPSLVGLGCAWFLILFFVQAGAGWNATHDRRESANELWWADTVPMDIIQLHQAMDQISEWQTGEPGELPAVIEWPEDSALGWELLTYRAAQYLAEADLLATPAVIVAPRVVQGNGVVAPQLTVAYRGEEFGSVEQRGWSGLPPDLISWLLYRRGPLLTGQMILWTRVDILAPDAGGGA